MTKEELEKEAEEYARDTYEMCSYSSLPYASDRRAREQAYIAAAEPREKRIAELEAEVERLKGNLELWESGACRATNLDKCGVVKELKAQIEKMKCCQNCLHLCARCELGIDGCYVCSKWELRR